MLVDVANRLAICVGACDTLARYGGDEFVIILEDLVDSEQAAAVVQRVRGCLVAPVSTSIGNLTVSASIGVHLAAPQDDYDRLLRAADAAMYKAKGARAR